MIPNWKGKVTSVNTAGLHSLYVGTPYVSTTTCVMLVNSFVWKCVGGIGQGFAMISM